VQGVFLADGSAKGLRRFCSHHKKTRLVIQNMGSKLDVLGNRREISSVFHLMIHGSLCITGLRKRISIQVIASFPDPGGLHFACFFA
jgi:hypothetical protein